jgi:vacuolar protein sorting-associated protein 13A/C
MVRAAGGFADGSKSLLRNAFMAPVGAMSKFGNSASKGLRAFSFDDKFIEEKNNYEKINKPQNFGDGVAKGFSSAGNSIWSGVSGVFTKPVEGAKEKGVGGFIKGIGKGGAGLVTKTVSGVVDIVAKTSEGLDNQTRSRVHALLAITRLRNPRPFYEHNSIIRPYNHFHANWAHKMAIS